MAVTITVDTSNVVDGQNIDAADVTLPFSQVKTALEDTLNGIQSFDRISFGTAELNSIIGGVISPTKSHVIADTQGLAATDDLDTINGGAAGRILFIRCNSGARVVVLKHGTGNIRTANSEDYALNSTDIWALLIHNGTNWLASLMPRNSYLNISFDTNLQIVSGAVTKSRTRHSIQAESNNFDDLDTINGGIDGDILVLQAAINHFITVRHNGGGTGNIFLANDADRLLDNPNQMLWLMFDSANNRWIEHAAAPGIPHPGTRNWWRERASSNGYGSIGIAAGTNTGAGALSVANDSDGTFVSQAIAATAGTFGGRRSTSFDLVRREYKPTLTVIFKTGADVTNIRFWIGLFSAAPTNVDTLAAATQAMGFRFSTVAGDATWLGVCSDSSSQSVVNVGIGTVTANTKYKLRIRCDANFAYFSVNDGQEVLAFNNLPDATQNLGFVVTAITTTASAKSIAISDIYCEYD